MFDVRKLMQALPVTGLEPESLASVDLFPDLSKPGFLKREWESGKTISFLEPPSGWQEPFVDPVETMAIIYRYLEPEIPKKVAEERARAHYEALRPNLDVWNRVYYYCLFDVDHTEYVPVRVLLRFFREKVLFPEALVTFLERAEEVTREEDCFRKRERYRTDDGGNSGSWALSQLSSFSSPESMIESMPTAPWRVLNGKKGEEHGAIFEQWLAYISSVAANLAKELGQELCEFQPKGGYDFDFVHRFLILHWCCSIRPEAPLVRYLIEASGAGDVEELKAGLIDPQSYAAFPFKLANPQYFGLTASGGHINYLTDDQHRAVGIVFVAEEERCNAESYIRRQINADIIMLAPEALCGDDAFRQSLRYCRSQEIFDIRDGQIDITMVELFLSKIDQLTLFAGSLFEPGRANPKMLETVEELIWMADERSIQVGGLDYKILDSFGSYMKTNGVPERIVAKKAMASRMEN